ncbi:MAG: hypothetical protein J6M01_01345 [Prevotella sp.]|nr:hypothetical protein [Prevotella sp.]
MKRLSIMTLLALFATTLTHQGGAWAQDSDTKADDWGQVKTVTSEWTHITEGSTSGYELKDAYYYVTEDLTFTNTLSGAGQGSGMYVQAGKTVNLYIPAGVTLTVKGADAQGTTGAGAGILLPSGTTLNIIGNGTLKATGGKAADGQKGGDGTDGSYVEDDDDDPNTWFLGGRITGGRGGYGGNGGGGAGAGIGTAGGNGGLGAEMLAADDSRVPHSYAEWDGGDLAGRPGDPGSAGSAAVTTMGTLNIQSTITQQISGGAKGNGGAAGTIGKGSFTGGDISFEGIEVEMIGGVPIPIPQFDLTDLQAIAGGGGGGGGAGGGSAQAIGTGGAGGGGGASGACGSGCAHNAWVNDNFGSVGAGGGEGGYGPESNNGTVGGTFWMEGDDNIFDDEDNHKPGGAGGAAGTPVSADKSSSVGEAVAPTYNVKYYAIGVTPTKNTETFQPSNSTKITLPSLNQGDSKYKWILSIYGNVLGETSGHCGGPNGDVYAPGDEVDLSNIYGDIEFCAVYVGCEIECADTWSSGYQLAYSTAFTPKYTIVNLKGRKLYKDGYWNTLTLPFDLSAEKLATTCLAGADIRRFKEASWDAGNERLTINFSDSNEGKIDAGVPYIIRWGEPGNATGEVINDPSFTNVSIELCDNEDLDEDEDEETANTYETQSNGLRFQGLIAPVQVQANSKTLLLGAENKFYKPNDQLYVYATRAYFTYTSGSGISMAREITLDFGDDEPISTFIENVEADGLRQNTIEGIFNLNGQRLTAPRKGINIINGRKVVIK